MKTTQTVVQTLLNSLLTQGKSTDVPKEKSAELETFIYQRLTSKKFRKTKMDEACAERTQRAIQLQMKADKPLRIIYPQGGYKLWRFPSSPEADWAEFFTIAYLVEYLLPIVHNYQPGVELVYYMHTLLMERHDNLTTQEIQAYIDSFQKLLDEFKKYLPKNFTITILKDADLYTRDEYFQRLEEGRHEAEKVYEEWPPDKKEEYLRMARLNIKWNGQENWEVLSQKEKDEKLFLAALYEMAASTKLERVFELVKSPDTILLFTKATKDFIGIGSTKTSIAKYWVGFGVLETNTKGELQPRILTPSQYEMAMASAPERVALDILPGENFKEILIFDKPFDFTKGV